MPAIILSDSRWKRQPLGDVELDYTNPLTKYLVAAYVGGNYRELVSGRAMTITNGVRAATVSGFGLTGSGSAPSASIVLPPSQRLAATDNVTLFARCDGSTVSTTAKFICAGKAGGNNQIDLWFGNGSTVNSPRGRAYTEQYDLVEKSSQVFHTANLTYSLAVRCFTYITGNSYIYLYTAASDGSTDFSPVIIGPGQVNFMQGIDTFQVGGGVGNTNNASLVLLYRKNISTAAFYALDKQPWALFRKRKQVFYFDVPEVRKIVPLVSHLSEYKTQPAQYREVDPEHSFWDHILFPVADPEPNGTYYGGSHIYDAAAAVAKPIVNTWKYFYDSVRLSNGALAQFRPYQINSYGGTVVQQSLNGATSLVVAGQYDATLGTYPNDSGCYFWSATTAGGGNECYISVYYVNPNYVMTVYIEGSSGANRTMRSFYTPAKITNFCMRWNPSDKIRLWVNGVELSAYATPYDEGTSSIHHSGTEIVTFGTVATWVATAPTSIVMWSTKPTAQAYAPKVSANPWQVFRKEPKTLYFNPPIPRTDRAAIVRPADNENLPSRTQPDRPVRLHPSTISWTLAAYPLQSTHGAIVYEAAKGKMYRTDPERVHQRTASDGIGLGSLYDGNTAAAIPFTTSNQTALTIVCVFNPRAFGTPMIWYAGSYSLQAQYFYSDQYISVGVSQSMISGRSFRRFTIPNQKIARICVTWTPSALSRLWLNGAEVSGTTAINESPTYYGAANTLQGFGTDGGSATVHMIAAIPSDVGATEAANLSLNPWRIFNTATPQILYFRIPTLTDNQRFTILSVDADNDIYHGQSGVIILPDTGVFAASGNKVYIEQGGTYIEQTVTAESASSITITVNLTGFTVPGSGTVRVLKPKTA